MDTTTINEGIKEGVDLHLAGRRAEAETKYRQLLELQEGNPVVHNNLGFLLAQNGRWEDALGEYHRAIELSPEYSTPYTNLGVAYLALNQFSEAGMNLARAIQLNPEDFYANEGMSRVCLLTGDLPAGEQFLKKSYMLEPKNELLYQLVLCLLGQLKLDEARDILAAIGSAGQNDVRWHNLWGLVHYAENNYGEAGRCFRRALGLEPENTEVRNSLVAVLLKIGALEEAGKELRRILQLAPRHLEALLNLGILELMAGSCDGSLEYLERAVEVEPGNNKALYYKAMVLVRQNKKKATVKSLLQKVARSGDVAYSAKAADLLKELTETNVHSGKV